MNDHDPLAAVLDLAKFAAAAKGIPAPAANAVAALIEDGAALVRDYVEAQIILAQAQTLLAQASTAGMLLHIDGKEHLAVPLLAAVEQTIKDSTTPVEDDEAAQA